MRRKRTAADSFGLDELSSQRGGSPALQPASATPRNVQQRRNPVDHTDLASVLELIEEIDDGAHTGDAPSLLGSTFCIRRCPAVQNTTRNTLAGLLLFVRAGLCEILRNHTYVGMADDTLALVQHQTRLYLADAYQLSRDLFYQQVGHIVRWCRSGHLPTVLHFGSTTRARIFWRCQCMRASQYYVLPARELKGCFTSA